MADQRDRVHQYGMESALMYRDLGLVDKLYATLEAALELQERGVAWEEAWRNDEDWQRVGRMGLLLVEVRFAIERAMNDERQAAWNERIQKRLSIHRVK